MSLRKLELTWIGKEDRPRLEPRILLEDAEPCPRLAGQHRRASGVSLGTAG
jgi:adenine-specific DNA-methyltransferase